MLNILFCLNNYIFVESEENIAVKLLLVVEDMVVDNSVFNTEEDIYWVSRVED